MAEIWRSLWRRFRLGHRLEQRRQRDEHGRRRRVAPAPRRTRLQPRRAAQVPDLLKLARLAERLANLQHRCQALVAALPTAEHDDLIAQMVMPLERAFRQLAGEAYKLWAARFPAQANAAGEAAFKQMQELLRSGSQPTSPRPNYAPSDDDFRLINADPAPGEAEE